MLRPYMDYKGDEEIRDCIDQKGARKKMIKKHAKADRKKIRIGWLKFANRQDHSTKAKVAYK